MKRRSGYRLMRLFKNPFFWTLTFAGNSIILLGSSLLYYFEHDHTRGPRDFIDCLLWSAGTVTTVGYGSFEPQTFVGKMIILALMLLGTLFVWSYMAFLVTGLLAPELAALERDVHEVEREIQEMQKNRSS